MEEQENNSINQEGSKGLTQDFGQTQERKNPYKFYYLALVIFILLILLVALFWVIDREREPEFTDREKREIIKREVEREAQQRVSPPPSAERKKEIDEEVMEMITTQGIEPPSEESKKETEDFVRSLLGN